MLDPSVQSLNQITDVPNIRFVSLLFIQALKHRNISLSLEDRLKLALVEKLGELLGHLVVADELPVDDLLADFGDHFLQVVVVLLHEISDLGDFDLSLLVLRREADFDAFVLVLSKELVVNPLFEVDQGCLVGLLAQRGVELLDGEVLDVSGLDHFAHQQLAVLENWNYFFSEVFDVGDVYETFEVQPQVSELGQGCAVLDLELNVSAHGRDSFNGGRACVLENLSALLDIELEPDEIFLLSSVDCLYLDLLFEG